MRFFCFVAIFVLSATQVFAQPTMPCSTRATTGSSYDSATEVRGEVLLGTVSCPANSSVGYDPLNCFANCQALINQTLPAPANYRAKVCTTLNLPHDTTVKAYYKVGSNLKGYAGKFGRVVRTNPVSSCPSGSTLSGSTCTAPLSFSCNEGDVLTSGFGKFKQQCSRAPVYTCPSFSVNFKKTCLADAKQSDSKVSCPSGFVYIGNGKCSQPAVLSCPGGGYSFNPAQTECVKPANKSCPAGFQVPSSSALACTMPVQITPGGCDFVRP